MKICGNTSNATIPSFILPLHLLYFQVFPDFGSAFYAIFYAICYQLISAFNDLYKELTQSYAIYAIVLTIISVWTFALHKSVAFYAIFLRHLNGVFFKLMHLFGFFLICYMHIQVHRNIDT